MCVSPNEPDGDSGKAEKILSRLTSALITVRKLLFDILVVHSLPSIVTVTKERLVMAASTVQEAYH